MDSKWVRFVVLAVIGFGLGSAMAMLQHKDQGVAGSILQHTAPASDTHSTPESMAGEAVGGAFSLIDQKGNPVTEKSWPGKYKLVFFGYTHCPDVCPVTLQKISAVIENIDPKGQKIAPLFITVDPARDTKDVLGKYVGRFNSNIVGLTGSQAQIDHVVDAYKAFVAKVPDNSEYESLEKQRKEEGMKKDYELDHSAYVYLMSSNDKLLETFSVDETAEDMIAKLKPYLAPGKNP